MGKSGTKRAREELPEPEAPAGLKLVDASQEGAMPDPADGDELWLFRVPPEFSLASLEGKSVTLPMAKTAEASIIEADGKTYELYCGGTTSDSMEASQVVAMFPSETGLQIRGAFQKNFIVTSETVSTDVAKHIPVNAKIMMHQGLRRRFCMPGSGLKPQKVAMPSKEELASKAEETPAKKDKKKKDKKEKSAKKKKKDK